MRDVSRSPFIIKEARDFVACEEELYKNACYPIILGTAFAHETAANGMLTNFYESLFLPYKNYYTQNEFLQVAQYFLDHINGLEQLHADKANESVKRHANSLKNIEYILEGGLKFLDAQSKLWDGLHREFIKVERTGDKIPLN